MSSYRVLIVDGDGRAYEDYIEVPGDEKGFGSHGLAVIKKIEDLYGESSDEKEYPPLYLMDNAADMLHNTELAFFKLRINSDRDDYRYLYLRKVRTATRSLINIFPIMVSLNDEDIKEIKNRWDKET